MDASSRSSDISDARRALYQDIRAHLESWADDIGAHQEYDKYIPLVPDLLRLLERLALDEAVPAARKAEIGVAISYVLSPRDTVPEEVVGPSGYVDDVALAAFVVQRVLDDVEAEVVGQHWTGDEDVAATADEVLAFARYSLGPEIWATVKEKFARPPQPVRSVVRNRRFVDPGESNGRQAGLMPCETRRKGPPLVSPLRHVFL